MEAIIFSIIILILVGVIGITEYKKAQKYKNGLMTEEEKEKYENLLNQRKTRQEKNYKAKTIKQVMILNNESDSRKKASSTIIRGAVGNSLLGPVGLVGGALSAKNKQTNKTTFLIEYQDGHRETKTVDNNSSEYKKLCNYLKMN